MTEIHYTDKVITNGRSSNHSIFLAGPTPREYLRNDDGTPAISWRPDCVERFHKAGYAGQLFLPETSHGGFCDDHNHQLNWEFDNLKNADAILLWVPRNLKTFPGFTTNVEFGYWLRDNKMFYGRPDGAPKTEYLDEMYRRIRQCEPENSLDDLIKKVLDFVHNKT